MHAPAATTAKSATRPVSRAVAGTLERDEREDLREAAAGLRSPGQPLDEVTRTAMESRFGHDFSRVRVHSDTVANRAADRIRASAYTFGSDVVFASGRYAPATASGEKLLAHELTHAVQQQGLAGAVPQQLGGAATTAELEAERAASSVAAGGAFEVSSRCEGVVQRQLDTASGVIRQFPPPEKLKRDELITGILKIVALLEKATNSSVELGDLEVKVLPAYIRSFINVSKAQGDQPVILGLKPENPVHRKVLDQLPQPPPSTNYFQPPAPTPPPAPPPPKPAPGAVLPTYAVWGPLFMEGMRDATKNDTKLQAGYQKLLLQLSSTQGKVEFGGGMALGLVPGALVAIADIPYSLWKTCVELGLKGSRTLSDAEMKKAVDDLIAATRKLAARLPELAGEIANQPKQAGTWAGVLVSAKIREDLFLEETPKAEEKPATPSPDASAKKPNPLDYSDLALPDIYKSTRDMITRGKAGEKGSFIFNKGVAGGMALGYTLMNIAMLFIGPEEMAAKAGSVGVKGLEALKATGLWKRLAAIAEAIPELKALAGAKRAATELKAGETAVKGAEGLGKAAADTGKAADETANVAGKGVKPGETPADPAAANKPSNRVPSHGELQEEPIRKLHHPKADLLSEKSSGFDFAEGYERVSAHTETTKEVPKGLTKADAKDLTVVTERIAGGDWIQLKSITVEEEVGANVDKAMERADNALKGVPKNKLEKAAETPGRKVYERAPEDLKPTRENQFERIKEGQAYRTSYARQPDRMTIHLHFENVPASDTAKLGQLEAQARQAVQASQYRAGLPPVRIFVSGK